MIFTCVKCNKEKHTPAKFVKCLGCNADRVRICLDCLTTFTGCTPKCEEKHRERMKTILKEKLL